MDFKTASNFLKKMVTMYLKDTPNKPSVSYIISKILNFKPTKEIIIAEFSPKEIIQLSYMVYFLFEGYDEDTAEYKAKNDIYMVYAEEVNSLDYLSIDCPSCDGYSETDCPGCNGTGEYECSCGGEDEECDECEGRGEVECPNCGGSGQIDCYECRGYGKVEAEDQSVIFDSEFWTVAGNDTFDYLKEFEDSDKLVDNFYDVLDKNKGSILLIRTNRENDTMALDEFESRYGDYYEHQGDYIINGIQDLNKTIYNFKINENGKGGTTIS